MPKLLEEFPPVSTEAWEDAVRADLKGADYDKTLVWRPEDGIAIKPYYRAEDTASVDTGPIWPTPGWRICEPGDEPPIDIDAAKFEESGATTVQELAFALAEGIEHLAAGKAHDVTFQFAIGSYYFFQIAKLRAFRLLWARVVEAFAIQDADLSLHCRTSRWNKSIYDAYVNILRSTTETLSAILGGADSVSVDPFDATYKTPSTASLRLAVNTQLILKHEAYLDRVADPAAGSYYVEALTDSLAREAWKLMQSIEAHEGSALSQAAKEAVFIGVNKYPNFDEKALPKLERHNASDVKRGPEPFEHIRLRTERSGAAPKFLLAEIGDVKISRTRSRLAADLFGCAGFLIEQERFESIDAIAAVKADVVVLCCSDADYARLAPVLIAKYRIVTSADPVQLGGNAVEKLTAWQDRLGIGS